MPVVGGCVGSDGFMDAAIYSCPASLRITPDHALPESDAALYIDWTQYASQRVWAMNRSQKALNVLRFAAIYRPTKHIGVYLCNSGNKANQQNKKNMRRKRNRGST